MTQPYILSFTAVSLGLIESITVARVYLDTHDWVQTKEIVKGDNLLQSRVSSSIQRVYQEVEPRLQNFSIDQMEFFIEEADVDEQKQLLWYAICKRYEFIRDFATEVLNHRYRMLHTTIEELDYTVFFNDKANWHEELRDLTESTRNKIRTVLFRIMREANFVTKDYQIIPCMPSQAVLNQIADDKEWAYFIYPMHSSQFPGGQA